MHYHEINPKKVQNKSLLNYRLKYTNFYLNPGIDEFANSIQPNSGQRGLNLSTHFFILVLHIGDFIINYFDCLLVIALLLLFIFKLISFILVYLLYNFLILNFINFNIFFHIPCVKHVVILL